MSKLLIEERGIFWIAVVSDREYRYHITDAVHGTFKISRDGSSEIELDRLFNERQRLKIDDIHECQIVGLLKNDKAIFMQGAHSFGSTLKSHNLDFESYRSHYCLYGDCTVQEMMSTVSSSKSISISLGEYEGWINEYPIKYKRNENEIAISSNLNSERVYSIEDFILKLRWIIPSPWANDGFKDDIRLRKKSVIEIDFGENKELEYFSQIYQRVQEFFVLVTNQEVALDWPIIFTADPSRKVSLYCYRVHAYRAEFNLHTSWTTFKDIENIFGDLLQAWVRNSSKIGAGYYLYIATRRGRFQYSESKFLSLVSGLEALHRQIDRSQKASTKYDKITEIINQIDELNSGDKRWLRAKLKHALEPTLSDRIFEMLSGIYEGIDRKTLRKLADQCANRRNNISHFGRVERENTGSEVYDYLSTLVNILDYLYHLRLLYDIGFPKEKIGMIIGNPRVKYSIDFYLRRFVEADKKS